METRKSFLLSVLVFYIFILNPQTIGYNTRVGVIRFRNSLFHSPNDVFLSVLSYITFRFSLLTYNLIEKKSLSIPLCTLSPVHSRKILNRQTDPPVRIRLWHGVYTQFCPGGGAKKALLCLNRKKNGTGLKCLSSLRFCAVCPRTVNSVFNHLKGIFWTTLFVWISFPLCYYAYVWVKCFSCEVKGKHEVVKQLAGVVESWNVSDASNSLSVEGSIER